MNVRRFLAAEFRYRIFISLGIVLVACLAAYVIFPGRSPLLVTITGSRSAQTIALVSASFLCALASALRMSAGTVLHSLRVMSFSVRPDQLATATPYNLVRNPIYLSDVIAAVAFALCMPAPGLLYPVLLLVHYRRLIVYEERELAALHAESFHTFTAGVPRLLPSPHSLLDFAASVRRLRIDRDGLRFNATYALFVPGLLVAAITGEFFHAVLIGLPGVADWAYWHTVKGLSDAPAPEVQR